MHESMRIRETTCPEGYWFLAGEDGRPLLSDNGFLVVATPPGNIQWHPPEDYGLTFIRDIGEGVGQLKLYEYRPVK